MRNKRVKDQRVRCDPPKDLNVLDIIPVLYFTVNTGIILIIIYYTDSIENTVSIIYYCSLYYSSAIIYSNMHTGTTLYYDACRYCSPNAMPITGISLYVLWWH